MNFQSYVYRALSLIQLLLIYTSFVCGDVINVFSPEASHPINTFHCWWIGDRSPDDAIEGRVVDSHPSNACEPILPPPHPANSTYGWFVLIDAYDCDLDLKLRMAEDAGYDAVISYERPRKSVQDDVSSTMLGSNSTIDGVFIKSDDWEIIRKKYLFSTGYFVQIVPDEPFSLFRYIIPFVIAVGICMILLMVFVLVKYVRERRRNQRNRLSSRHLKQLPVIKFKKGDHYDICAICLEEYNEGNKLRVLPCSHAYHTKCIDPWLLNSQRTCPVCKRKVCLNGESSDSESDSESELPTEITPLLREVERRVVLIRNQLSNRRFRENPVINADQQDVIQSGNRSDGESSQTYCIRPSLLEESAALLAHSVYREHHTSESDNASAYSSSAPSFLPSTAAENDILNQPSTSSEQPSSLPNITPSTSHTEVVTEIPGKEKKKSKDMVV